MEKDYSKTAQKKINRMIDLYKQGYTTSEIADEVWLSRNTVHKYLVETGAKVIDPEVSKGTSKRLTKKEKQLIIERYKQGVKVDDIAEELDITVSVMYRYINRLGLTRYSSKELVQTAIKQHLTKSQPLDMILKQAQISRSTFYRHLRKYKETDEYKEKYETE